MTNYALRLFKKLLWFSLLAVVYGSAAHSGTVQTTEDQEATGFADSRKAVRDPTTGRLYVAYRSKFKQDNATNYRIYVSYSDDSGGTWSVCNSGLPIDTEGSYKQRVPSIAISPDTPGTLHVTWYGLHFGKAENQREIKYSRSGDECASWSNTRRITDDSGFVDPNYAFWQEHPVVQAYGNFVFITWEGRDGSTTDGAIRFVRSSDKGLTFGTSQFVQRAEGYAYSRPTLQATGVSAAPTLWMAAHAYDSSNALNPRKIWWTKSTDAGVTWTQSWALVCGSCTGDQRHVSMSRDTNGKSHLAWRETAPNGYAQVYYAKFGSSSFGSPVAVSAAAKYQFSPQLEVDQARANKVYVIWSETTNAWNFPNEKPADGYLFYATKADSSASFLPSSQLTIDGFATYPTWRRTAKTLDGNLDAVWTEYTSGSTSTTFRIKHQPLVR